MEKETRIGLFTGTFDPFTIGHQNIVDRVLPLFDKLVIAVAVSKLKHTSEEIEARVQAIKAVFAGEKRVEVRPYADPRLSSISSSMVRELQFFGKDVAEWLPQPCSGNPSPARFGAHETLKQTE